MKLLESEVDCQIPCLQRMAEGSAEMPPQSLARRLKLMIRRRLSPQMERRVKMRSNALMNWLCRVTGKPERPAVRPTWWLPQSI